MENSTVTVPDSGGQDNTAAVWMMSGVRQVTFKGAQFKKSAPLFHRNEDRMEWSKEQKWAEKVLVKIEKKYSHITARTAVNFFPYTIEEGRMVPSQYEKDYEWWTNGFYPGILWKLYLFCGKEEYRNLAVKYEDLLDIPLHNYEGLHHDAGFMWLPSAVANYRITGNRESRKRGLLAASTLMSRFNIEGNFIRAWNGKGEEGWAIIDSMMNVPLLYWAGRELEDPRFSYAAKRHADKIKNNFIRQDGSVRHIVSFDIRNGEFLEELAGQGYKKGSAWTRGQAWAIYGFYLSFLYTGREEYLDTAKNTAHYFLANLAARRDYIPPCDFRSPYEPVYTDTTAGLIGACGMLEIGKAAEEGEKELYLQGALEILHAVEERYCNWEEESDCMVMGGTERYGKGINMPIIYGDYYFLEALLKITEKDILFW